jgi:hypothetical protein
VFCRNQTPARSVLHCGWKRSARLWNRWSRITGKWNINRNALNSSKILACE